METSSGDYRSQLDMGVDDRQCGENLTRLLKRPPDRPVECVTMEVPLKDIDWKAPYQKGEAGKLQYGDKAGTHKLAPQQVREFDRIAAGFLVVCMIHQQPKFQGIDGRNRANWMEELGIGEWAARVLSELSTPEQALLFSHLNDRKNPTLVESVKCLYRRNDPDVVRMLSILNRWGFTYPFLSDSVRKPVSGMSAVLEIYRRQKGEMLNAILEQVVEAGWIQDGNATNSLVLKGVLGIHAQAALLKRPIQKAAIIEAMRKFQPETLLTLVRMSTREMSGHAIISLKLGDAYNKRVRKESQLNFDIRLVRKVSDEAKAKQRQGRINKIIGAVNLAVLSGALRAEVNSHKPGTRWSEAMAEWVKTEYSAGRSLGDIAKVMRTSYSTVKTILRSLGIYTKEATTHV